MGEAGPRCRVGLLLLHEVTTVPISFNPAASSIRQPTQAQQPDLGSALDSVLGQAEQQIQQSGGADSPLAKIVDQIKKALESGQLTPQDALSQFTQALQGAQQTQGTQAPQGVSGPSGTSSPAAVPQDSFQNQAQTPQNVDGASQPHGHHHHHGHRAGVKAAADAMGMTPDALRQELKQGKSINDVATEHGVDPNAVDAAVKSALQQKMPNATDDELTNITNRITSQQRTPPVDPNAEVMSAMNFPQNIQA
jgi:hypothetical protein